MVGKEGWIGHDGMSLSFVLVLRLLYEISRFSVAMCFSFTVVGIAWSWEINTLSFYDALPISPGLEDL